MRPCKANNYLIPPATGVDTTVKKNAVVEDTLRKMKEVVEQYHYQVHGLAQYLYHPDTEQYCRNIWNFVKGNIRYAQDTEGIEELRTPSRSFADKNNGIDCDCMTIFICALLKSYGVQYHYQKDNNGQLHGNCIRQPEGIANDFRVVAWNEKRKWNHIYPVAYDRHGNSYIIDCIPEVNQFNKELTHKDQMDIAVLNGAGMSTEDATLLEALEVHGISEDESMNGADDSPLVLSGFEETDEYDPEKTHTLNGDQVANLNEADVFGQLKENYRALDEEKNRTGGLNGVCDTQQEFNYCGKIIMAWPVKSERYKALQEAAEQSKFSEFYKACACQLERGETLRGTDEQYHFIEPDEEEDDTLGRKNKGAPKKKLGQTKVGKLLKKVVHSVAKVGPLATTIRNGILLALKKNISGLATDLKYAFMSEAQALQHGITTKEWLNRKEQLAKLEKRFYLVGGNPANLHKAIIHGKAGGLAGDNNEDQLGFAPLIAAAATKIIQMIAKGIKNSKAKKASGQNSGDGGDDGGAGESGGGGASGDFDSNSGKSNLIDKSASTLNSSQQQIQKETTDNPETTESKTNTQTKETMAEDTSKTKDVTTTDAAAEDTGWKGKAQKMWQDHKWKIIGTAGLVLIIILVLWFMKRKKKGGSLNGRRRRRKPTTAQPALYGSYKPLTLAGRKRRKKTSSSTQKKKRRR